MAVLQSCIIIAMSGRIKVRLRLWSVWECQNKDLLFYKLLG